MSFRLPFLSPARAPMVSGEHRRPSVPGGQSPKKYLFRGVLCAALTMQVLTGCANNVATATQEIQWELTPEAQLTYATLLLDQSIRDENPAGVIEAAHILLTFTSNPQLFVDASAWLILHRHSAEAKEILEKAVLKAPDELTLHLLLSEAWIEQNNRDKAVQILQEFSERHPGSRLAKQELGILYVKVERYAEAERLFAALPANMMSPFVLFARAEALQALNQPQQAIARLRQAVEESPDFIDAWFALARLLEQQKQFSEASEIYASLIEQDPENEDIWIRLVEGEIHARRPEKALEYAWKGPETFGFRLTAGALLLDSKLFREAETLLLALRERPNVPPEVNFYLAAIAFEFHKDNKRTLELLEAIPENNRFYDRALRLRIQLLYDADRRTEALPLILRGQQLYPEDKDFSLMEAHLLIGKSLYSEALARVDKALGHWPENEELLYLRVNVLDLLGRRAEAFKTIEGLLAKNPDSAIALNYIGYALAEQGKDLDHALELLNKANTISPNRGFILDSLAWAYYRKGNLDLAWKMIARAVTRPDGNDAAIWEHYGDIAKARRDNTEARRGWTRALNAEPEHPERIRAKLEALQ